jgi:tetratricopeptide (TPR) repeat protein
MKAKLNAPARFAVLVVSILATVVVIMVPRSGEWWAVMQDEDRQAQIIALLEPQLATSPEDPDLLATLARAYAETGNRQKATELLEHFIRLRPGDADAYARLASLYESAGDATRQIAMLERSLAIAPQLTRAAELAAVYRDRRMTDAELALLSRFDGELTVESGLLLRLVELRDDAGDRDGAIRTLMRPAVLNGSSKPEIAADAQIRLARLLFQAGRGAEAVRLGKQWILQWRESWLANRLLRAIVLKAPVADASELADAVVASHPEIRFWLAYGLAEMGARPVARHLLAGWSAAVPSPSTSEIAGFLSACRDLDDPSVVWQAFAGVLGRPEAAGVIGRYTEAIAAEFGIGALAPFWARIPPAVIAGKPLLAARLAFHEQNLAMSRWLIERIDPAALDTADRRVWVDILTAAAPPAEAFAVLHKWRIDGHLPPDLLVRYARLAASLGQEDEVRAALADAQIQAD